MGKTIDITNTMFIGNNPQYQDLNKEGMTEIMTGIAGEDIYRGDPVYINSDGLLGRAISNGSANRSYAIGIASNTIFIAQRGSVITRGIVKIFAQVGECGQRAYLGWSGGLSEFVPARNFIVQMGIYTAPDLLFIQIQHLGRKAT